jgi:SAM-dependent methyltransferase
MYEPFPYMKMKKLFTNFSFSESDGFMDIGCGKGRVLIGAAFSGCVNVYGIDISAKLLKYAEKNLAECKKKKADLKYKLLCMDVKDLTFTPDINKLFFYNPFSYRVFLKVMKALKKSVEENPRDVTIFLAGPKHVSRYLVGDKDFFFTGIDQKNVYIYRHVCSLINGCGSK